MCKTKKLRAISSILVFCLVVSLSATSWAATESVVLTTQEYSRLRENLNRLDRICEVLSQNSEQSARDLLTVEQKLRIADDKLAKAEARLLQYENELKQMQELLLKQDSSLTKANQLLTQLSNETKAEINNLKLQRAGLLVAVGALAFKAFAK